MSGDFDPEAEFDSACKAMGEVELATGEIPAARRADAQLQLLAVIAHQLGAIARYYERCGELLLNPVVERNSVAKEPSDS